MTEPFKGNVWRVKIHDHALSAEEIAAGMNKITSGQIAEWRRMASEGQQAIAKVLRSEPVSVPIEQYIFDAFPRLLALLDAYEQQADELAAMQEREKLFQHNFDECIYVIEEKHMIETSSLQGQLEQQRSLLAEAREALETASKLVKYLNTMDIWDDKLYEYYILTQSAIAKLGQP